MLQTSNIAHNITSLSYGRCPPLAAGWIRGSVWPWAAPAVAELVVEQPCAEVDAFVTDRAGWSGDDLLDVAGGFATERSAASELAAELACVVVGELGGDLPGGVGELLVGAGAGFGVVGFGVVEGGRELVRGAVQQLPGGDGESWALAVQFPGGHASRD
jgi:hypothetical protein